jgi:hypothetical protein
MTPAANQRAYRAHVRRMGPLSIRRLHRRCPGCEHVTLYCAERRFCGESGEKVCTDSLCVECGWQGSTNTPEDDR